MKRDRQVLTGLPRNVDFIEWERTSLESFKQVNDMIWFMLRYEAAVWKMDEGHLRSESKKGQGSD